MPQPAWQPACPDPNFPFQQASGGPYCYNSASIAASNSGPCDSWCTTDSLGNGGCGNNAQNWKLQWKQNYNNTVHLMLAGMENLDPDTPAAKLAAASMEVAAMA